jgi:hypothetical protein
MPEMTHDAQLLFTGTDLAGRVRTFESFYAPVEFPQLYVEAVHKRLCLFSGLRFVLAIEIDPGVNMAVRAKDVGPIVRH